MRGGEQLDLFSRTEPVEVRRLPRRAGEGEEGEEHDPTNPRSEAVRVALERIRWETGAIIGRAGLGWRYSTTEVDQHGHRVIELDVEELEILNRIHDLRSEGLSLRQIAATLDREGRKTKRGGQWHASTVRSVLSRGGRLCP